MYYCGFSAWLNQTCVRPKIMCSWGLLTVMIDMGLSNIGAKLILPLEIQNGSLIILGTAVNSVQNKIPMVV